MQSNPSVAPKKEGAKRWSVMENLGSTQRSEPCACTIDVGIFLVGALAVDEVGEMTRHLAECAHCAEELEYLRPVTELLARAISDRGFGSKSFVDQFGSRRSVARCSRR